MAMFKRKLMALEYADLTLDINDEEKFRGFVYWLEAEKIRCYPEDERDSLKDAKSANWPNVFNQYIEDVGCPLKTTRRVELTEWLIGHAVSLEFADNSEKYTAEKVKEHLQKTRAQPKVVSTNSMDNIDWGSVGDWECEKSSHSVTELENWDETIPETKFESDLCEGRAPKKDVALNMRVDSEDFKNGVNSLADLLEIPRHPDHLQTLKAVSSFVCNRLTSEKEIQRLKNIDLKNLFPLDKVDASLNSGDVDVDNASRVLRLLFLKDLREGQDYFNDVVVGYQKLCASPLTDLKQARIGFS